MNDGTDRERDSTASAPLWVEGHWEEVEHAFDDVFALPEVERWAAVDQMPPGPVREGVETLLLGVRSHKLQGDNGYQNGPSAQALHNESAWALDGETAIPARPRPPSAGGPHSAADLVGTRAGSFVVRRKVGEGGMGTVYFADDPRTGQRAAVKVLTSAAPSARARFVREQRQLAALSHESIPKLLGSGTTTDGRPFFAMEYVRGAPVTDFARSHSLSSGERIEVFALLCEAVRHAHAHLVVHRDLKPSNVLASKAPGGGCRVHLLDFGVAKPLDDQDYGTEWGRGRATTGQGLRPMTPAYAAPEQALPAGAGRAAETTTATDVFALGTILYELLTGRRPLEGGAPPSQVADLGLGWRRRWAVDAVVERAIDPDPDARYGSADALYADVHRVLKGRPPVGVHVGFARRAAWVVARHRAGLVAASACVLAVVLAFTTAERRWRAASESAERTVVELVEVVEEAARSAPAEAVAGRSFLVGLGDIVETRVGTRQTVRADLVLALADQLSARGYCADAMPLYGRAALLRTATAPDHPVVIAALQGQARCAAGLAGREVVGAPTAGGVHRATALATEARALATSRFGDESAVTAGIDTDLALYGIYGGEPEVALDLAMRAGAVLRRLRRAREGVREGGGREDAGVALPLGERTDGLTDEARAGAVAALALTALGDHAGAVEHARTVVQSLHRFGPPSAPRSAAGAWTETVSLGLYVEAISLQRAGSHERASETADQTAALLGRRFGEGDRRAVRARAYALSLRAASPVAAPDRRFTGAYSTLVADAEATGDPAVLALALTGLASALLGEGRTGAATDALRRVVAMRVEDAGPEAAAIARAALAEVALASGDVPGALDLAAAAHRIVQGDVPVGSPCSPTTLAVASARAEALVADGRGEGAVGVLEDALRAARFDRGADVDAARDRADRLLRGLTAQ